MSFSSRQDAGRQLGEDLARRDLGAEVVLGLPRGGVIVAAEVARCLEVPLDVLVVRKVGHPRFREFAIGALAEAGVVILDEAVLQRAHVDREELAEVVSEEAERLRVYEQKFARPRRPERRDKRVILIDDGLATGSTVEAAVRSARQQEARRITVAVPAASTEGAARIGRVCDEFYALIIDPDFQAVGQYYRSFTQTTDEEVQQALGMLPGEGSP